MDNGGKLKPGDLIAYGNGSHGHVMLYVGNDRVIHSTTGAPKTYRDAGNETNTAGIPGAKYHLESKADIIETESGTLEVAKEEVAIKELEVAEKMQELDLNDLDNLYMYSKYKVEMSESEQKAFLKEAEKVFDKFEKIPSIIWEDEYEKYTQVLDTYKSIRMLRWSEMTV